MTDEPTPSPSSDDEAVKVVADALKKLSNEPAPTTEEEGYRRVSEVAVAALRRAGWGPNEADGLTVESIIRHSEEKDSEIDGLQAAILDIAAHATPYGDIPDEPGWVGTYLVTAGALHRALGKIGHTAPACEAEAERDEARSLLRDLEEATSTNFHTPRGVDDEHHCREDFPDGYPNSRTPICKTCAALAAIAQARKEQGWQ